MVNIIEYIGTFAFAISGVRLASEKKFDLFGAFICGFATAVGGGTLRDVFLRQTPFWMISARYLICTAAALIFVIVLKRYLRHIENTIFIFDTIGLSLFTVAGIEKTLVLDFPLWVCVIMGMITGAAGGIIRDVLLNEVPIIFHKEIYALACVFGGIVFCVLYKVGVPWTITQIATGIAVMLTRIIAVHFHISLPKFK